MYAYTASIKAASEIKFQGNVHCALINANLPRRIKFCGHRLTAIELIQVPTDLGKTARTSWPRLHRRDIVCPLSHSLPLPLRPLPSLQLSPPLPGVSRHTTSENDQERAPALEVPISQTVTCPASWHPLTISRFASLVSFVASSDEWSPHPALR